MLLVRKDGSHAKAQRRKTRRKIIDIRRPVAADSEASRKNMSARRTNMAGGDARPSKLLNRPETGEKWLQEE